MAQLGNSSTGTTFSISGSFNQSQTQSYTTPSDGIIVDKLNCIAAANGSASTARLYIWRASDSVWLIRGTTFSLGTGIGTVSSTNLSANGASGYPGLFIPGGVGVNFGIWVSSANYNWDAASTGLSHIGTGGDGNYVNHGTASGPGVLAAWCDYHSCLVKIRRGGVWVNQPLAVRRSGAWIYPKLSVRRSGAWVQLQ